MDDILPKPSPRRNPGTVKLNIEGGVPYTHWNQPEPANYRHPCTRVTHHCHRLAEDGIRAHLAVGVEVERARDKRYDIRG